MINRGNRTVCARAVSLALALGAIAGCAPGDEESVFGFESAAVGSAGTGFGASAPAHGTISTGSGWTGGGGSGGGWTGAGASADASPVAAREGDRIVVSSCSASTEARARSSGGAWTRWEPLGRLVGWTFADGRCTYAIPRGMPPGRYDLQWRGITGRISGLYGVSP